MAQVVYADTDSNSTDTNTHMLTQHVVEMEAPNCEIRKNNVCMYFLYFYTQRKYIDLSNIINSEAKS